jgi:hypothetical protein
MNNGPSMDQEPSTKDLGLLLPWVLMIAGDGVAVWRGYLAAWWYRQWLMERALDPSGAELYYVNAQFEAAYAVAALVVAGIGVALLLRAQRRNRRLVSPP